MLSPPIGTPLYDLETPSLVVDAAALERNIARMADWSRRTGIGIRPHAKAHKTPLVARKQIDAGAVGICCAKLGEAEAMAEGGISGLLVTSEVVGPLKVARLISLARHTNVMVVVDDLENALALSHAARAAGLELGVVVEVNVGQERCGVAPGAPAAELAARVADLPHLRFDGLQGYEGHLQLLPSAADRAQRSREAIGRLAESRRAVEARGLPVGIVSTAGTGTHEIAATIEGVTEVQPGSYIWMDSTYRKVEGTPFESALTVLASVVSRQRDGAVIVDAGVKALSTDSGPAAVKGEGLTYTPMGDEHGKVAGAALPGLGDRLELVPSHCDTTVNLYDALHVVRDGRLEAVWRIAGRGRVQ